MAAPSPLVAPVTRTRAPFRSILSRVGYRSGPARAWRRAGGPGATRHGHAAGRPRLPPEPLARPPWELLLADMICLSNAMFATILANVLDMNVITSGSLLSRLSHHLNGLSTQPPSKLGMLPS